MAFKARCSFKMVISRPHEHLARGQFNSGRMIAPSRSYCPFIFLRLPLSIQSATPSDLVRTRYTPRARLCDFHPLASFSKGRSLVRAFAKGRLFRPSFCTFSPSRAPVALSLPSNYFDGNCFSLVSIRVCSIRNFPIAINGGDQASSLVNTQLVLQSYRLLIP